MRFLVDSQKILPYFGTQGKMLPAVNRTADREGRKGGLFDYNSNMGLRDNGGRRIGIDRRKVSVPRYTPERRSGQDRRSNQDRRGAKDWGEAIYLKRGTDRYLEFAHTQKGLFFGLLLSLPFWALILFNYYK
jgi:hypothetical protein